MAVPYRTGFLKNEWFEPRVHNGWLILISTWVSIQPGEIPSYYPSPTQTLLIPFSMSFPIPIPCIDTRRDNVINSHLRIARPSPGVLPFLREGRSPEETEESFDAVRRLPMITIDHLLTLYWNTTLNYYRMTIELGGAISNCFPLSPTWRVSLKTCTSITTRRTHRRHIEDFFLQSSTPQVRRRILSVR